MSYLDLCMKELIQVQKIQRDLAINELKRRQQSNNNNNGPSVGYSNLAQLCKTFQCQQLQQQPAMTIQQQPHFGQMPQLNFLGIINIPNGNNVNRGNQQQVNQQIRQNRPSNLVNTVITNHNQNTVTASSTNAKSGQTNPNIVDECSNSMPCSSNSTNPNVEAEKDEEQEQIVDVESVENDKNDKEEKMEESKSEKGDPENEEGKSENVKCREIKSEFEGEENREMEKEIEAQTREIPEVEIKEEMVETSEIDEMIAANEQIENGIISQKSDDQYRGNPKMKNKEQNRTKDGKSRKNFEEYSEKEKELVPEKEKPNNIECEWAHCGAKFADDNQLYDHIKTKHIIEPNQNDYDDNNGDENNSYGCKWHKCDQTPRRGDTQRKYAWLLNHILVRHTPKAEIHICLFVGCKLRFKKVQALTQHLHMAHAEHGEQPRKRGRKRKNPVQLFHHRDQQTKEGKIGNTNTEMEQNFENGTMANQIDEEEKIFGLDKEEE